MDPYDIFHAVKPLFDAHKDKPYVEFELRLGRHNGKAFDTDVGKSTFDAIVKALQAYPEWEEVGNTNTEVYTSGNIRMVVNEEADTQEVHSKTRLDKIDLHIKDSPFDARFSVALETPMPDFDTDIEMEYVRIRSRTSFIRKNLSIDCTVIKGEDPDPDAEDDTKYQIEMEIIDPTQVHTNDDLFNILYKLQDILDTIK